MRFAPRFFEPAAETYFSYSFAWVLGGEPRLDAASLGAQLRRDFAGRMTAVGGGKGRPAAARRRDEGAGRWAGVVTTVDGFGEGGPLRLNVEAEAAECAGRRVVFFTLSPREPGDPLWGRLREQRALFRCRLSP